MAEVVVYSSSAAKQRHVQRCSNGGIPASICPEHQLLSWWCSWLQNDLEFLRIRSYKHEIMVAPSEWPCSALHACCCCKVLCNWLRTQLLTADPDFVLIVIQDPSVEA